MITKMDRKDIAERLKALRGEETKASVAAALGVTPMAVGLYESGQRIPNDDIKIRYAILYGKTVDEIFFTAR